MNLGKRIEAYTIIEVVVTISISSIIILSSLMIYLSCQKAFKENLQSIKENTELILFNNQINKDVKIAEKILQKHDMLIFQQVDSSEISYQFLNNFIIRYGKETQDTHFIRNKNIEYNYVVNKLINEIEFDIKTESSMFKYYIYKEYNNSTLVNLTLSDGN